jgi:hypothetical protein
MEQPIILRHSLRVEHGVQRGLDLVFQRKAVPSQLAVRVFQHSRIEPTEDIGVVVLRVGTADGGFEVRGEMVSVKRNGLL